MLGYCSTGSRKMHTAPPRHMMIEMTAAKIGRSMKNRENTAALLGGSPAAGRRSVGAGTRDRCADLQCRTRGEHQLAIDDDAVAASQAFVDEPVVAMPGPDG